jgi:2-polyprenyl-3-methyl-5-hydroxy-6-metoxy-1,4-benzoquinol methylase
MVLSKVNENTVDYEKTRFATERLLDLRSISLRVLKVRRALSDLHYCVGQRILDLGCGEGALARTLKRQFPQLEVHGCDVSVAQLARAEALGGGVIYGQCGVTLLYADASFDIVFVMDVLEHVDDPEAFVAEVSRILRTGGRLFLHCPCEGQPNTLHWLCWKLGVAADLKREIAGHIQRFTHRTLDSLLRRHGFVCQRRRFAYHLFGQAFDLLAFFRKKCQRDVAQGRTGRVKRLLASLPWYRIFPTMECVAGLESRMLAWLPLAMGVDACFEKQ